MTDRETQIFQWIKENPMISQQEIADRANIARSSVAVHISNLMKKGKIRGKGYVLQEEDYITIIGAVAIDIFGVACGDLVNQISNPGRIRTSLGGVGRNISENISRLGKKVELITVFGDDVYGEEGQRICRNFDIGASVSNRLPSHGQTFPPVKLPLTGPLMKRMDQDSFLRLPAMRILSQRSCRNIRFWVSAMIRRMSLSPTMRISTMRRRTARSRTLRKRPGLLRRALSPI